MNEIFNNLSEKTRNQLLAMLGRAKGVKVGFQLQNKKTGEIVLDTSWGADELFNKAMLLDSKNFNLHLVYNYEKDQIIAYLSMISDCGKFAKSKGIFVEKEGELEFIVDTDDRDAKVGNLFKNEFCTPICNLLNPEEVYE